MIRQRKSGNCYIRWGEVLVLDGGCGCGSPESSGNGSGSVTAVVSASSSSSVAVAQSHAIAGAVRSLAMRTLMCQRCQV